MMHKTCLFLFPTSHRNTGIHQTKPHTSLPHIKPPHPPNHPYPPLPLPKDSGSHIEKRTKEKQPLVVNVVPTKTLFSFVYPQSTHPLPSPSHPSTPFPLPYQQRKATYKKKHLIPFPRKETGEREYGPWATETRKKDLKQIKPEEPLISTPQPNRFPKTRPQRKDRDRTNTRTRNKHPCSETAKVRVGRQTSR